MVLRFHGQKQVLLDYEIRDNFLYHCNGFFPICNYSIFERLNMHPKFNKSKQLNSKFKQIFGFSLSNIFNPIFGLDIIALDTRLSAMNPGYNPINLTYNGKKNVSMNDFIKLRYGKDAVSLITELI